MQLMGLRKTANCPRRLLLSIANARMEGIMCNTSLVRGQIVSEIGAFDRPVYTIGVAAEILGVHPRTLRIYETKNLLLPARRGNWRFFSERDLMWARGIQYLLHEVGMSVAGLQRILALIPCWELLPCSGDEMRLCPKSDDKRVPCWAAVPRPDGKCYNCRVYQGTPAWLLDGSELATLGRTA